MRVDVKMPKIGDSEGPYVMGEWNVKVGDQVNRGEKLCLVELDKASTDIVSDHTGTLVRIIVGDGDEVNPQDVYCIVDV